MGKLLSVHAGELGAVYPSPLKWGHKMCGNLACLLLFNISVLRLGSSNQGSPYPRAIIRMLDDYELR